MVAVVGRLALIGEGDVITAADTVRVGVLGPLEVTDAAGRPVHVGGQRVRALLILLALDADSAWFAGSAWFAELAPVTEPSEVPYAVLDALGLRERSLGLRGSDGAA